MSRLKEVKEEYITTVSIRNLVSTYQEIASLRMRAVRDYVLQNREYFLGLQKIYALVMNSYASEIDDMQSKAHQNKKKSGLAFRRNGKKLHILLSANTSLYGSIIQETFNNFLTAIKEDKEGDYCVVGKTGRVLMQQHSRELAFKYFDLADTLDDTNHITEIQNYFLQYETVVIYHGVFISILEQQPQSTYITGGLSQDTQVNKNVHFMFEPDLEQVLYFFENQIIASSFIQTLNESYLSKYASRMISLDHALNDIDRRMKKLLLKKQQVKHFISNKKQLDLIAGRAMWTK